MSDFNEPFSLSTGSKIVVRPEEALIVIFVLILWAGAIGLFVYRWGKIRNCEPYTPKFEAEDHRGSCHDQTNLINKRMSMSVTKQGMPGTSQAHSLPNQMSFSGKGTALRNLNWWTLKFYFLQASHRLIHALDRTQFSSRLFKWHRHYQLRDGLNLPWIYTQWSVKTITRSFEKGGFYSSLVVAVNGGSRFFPCQLIRLITLPYNISFPIL